MTAQKNQARSGSGQVSNAELSNTSETKAVEDTQRRGDRRTFLRGIGVVGTISLAGCSDVTLEEDGISWGDGDDEDTTNGDEADDKSDDEGEENDEDDEDDELDLSEYEDGCFTGGDPEGTSFVRDDIEVTVTANQVDDQPLVLVANRQYEAIGDVDLIADEYETDFGEVIEEQEDETLEAEIVEIELEEDDEDDELIEAELTYVEEDEEDDD